MDLILLQTSKTTLNLSLKKNETLAENPPVQIDPNENKNIIFFKIKTGCKLGLLTPETMELLGSGKNTSKKIKTEKIYQN